MSSVLKRHVSATEALLIANETSGDSATASTGVESVAAKALGFNLVENNRRIMTLYIMNHQFEEILLGVDIARLREVCVDGIPDEPVQLRPIVWSMLLELVPSKGDRDAAEATSRHMYYVRPRSNC